MSLKNTIDADIKKAMLDRNKEELEALRGIKSLILLAETEKGGAEGLTPEAESKLLMKAAKQRKESAEIFRQQGRNDLADKELFQLEIINRYLPKMLSEDELVAELKTIIREAGAQTPQDAGRVIGIAAKKLTGKADGRTIAEWVKKLLAG